MRFRLIMTATVLALLAILFVIQTPGTAQKKTEQDTRATGQAGEIIIGAIGGVVVALVDGIVGITKSVFDVPQSRRRPSKSTKAR